MVTNSQADVLLVVPPFGFAGFPSLGVSLLATACRQRNLRVVVLYANLSFAAKVGYERYHQIVDTDTPGMIGEYLFRAEAFPNHAHCGFDGYVNHVISQINTSNICDYATKKQLPRIGHDDFEQLAQSVAPFMKQTVASILHHTPRIVGFTSMFQQTLAGIALARRIKECRPTTITVLGGPDASHPMGRALADVTLGTYDIVFSGEADLEFPRFCEELIHNDTRPPSRVIDCEPVRDLDPLPIPDYHEYFQQVARLVDRGGLPKDLPNCLHFETSRGCWWGAKRQCTFCGLNGPDITYRRKSASRVMGEIRHLAKSYKCRHLNAVDNIMPIQFRKTVLPDLADAGLDVNLWFEIKANQRPEDMDLFVKARVTGVQPGIESLSSHILRLMNKGVSAIQNICLLRDAASRQVYTSWNILTGFPGERRTDYEGMIQLFPMLHHLEPPEAVGQLRIDRNSPYQRSPGSYGIDNVRPFPHYDGLFPRNADLGNIASHFLGDYETEFLVDLQLQAQFQEAVEEWHQSWARRSDHPSLFLVPISPEDVLVKDTRRCAESEYYALRGIQLQLLLMLQRPVARKKFFGDTVHLDELLRRHFVIEYEETLLTIVTIPMLGALLRNGALRSAFASSAFGRTFDMDVA